MDSRVSTAVGPKAKRWSKNPGSSHLLRNVRSVSTDRLAVEASEEESRPQTCPAPTLTPHLHWNLNNSALTMLPENQVEELYGLFKFYDSSTVGDALPSVNCARFMETLRDAGLLDNSDAGSSSAVPPTEGLRVESVERIFAQAVMGKMRVYLDADDQPALTFSLFCGAIMNCAMLLLPSEHPTDALRKTLPRLLACSIGTEQHAVVAKKGLIGHLPTDGTLSSWIPEQSYAPLPQPEEDFRDLPSFQQVIADCESDMALEELRREKVAKVYHIPDRLLASFEHDTIALILDKFRLYDVSERGVLPRHEIFALLSGLGKRADLPDPYSVLPRLFGANNPMGTGGNGGGISSGSEMTIAELLLAIEVTREAKRHSSAARLASMKIRLNRAATTARHSLTVEPNAGDNNQGVLDLYDAPVQDKSASTEGSKAVKERGRRRGVLKPRKSTLSQASDSDNTIRALNTKPRGSKAHLMHHPSTANRRKAILPRRTSSINSNKAEAMTTVAAELLNQDEPTSRRPSVLLPTAREKAQAGSLDTDIPNSNDTMSALQQAPDADHEPQLQCPSTITIEVCEPPSANNRKTIRIFLLLGGDHDGAICCTISLVFATKEVTESEGIFYATAPNETTRTKSVLPTQKTLATALRMLKKCVITRMQRGFEQRPAGQLIVVDKMLQDLNNRQPHYSTPVLRTSPSRQTLVTAPVSANAQRSGIPRHISSAPSELHQAKLPPHSKSTRLQSKLPKNYRDLLATWQVDTWVHDVNAASPLKPALYGCNQAMPCRSGHLSPLRFPSRPTTNQIKNTEEP